MPSPGSQQITAQSPGRATGDTTPTGLELLREARERERQGPLPAAIDCYQRAIAVAERSGAPAVLSEGLRRLAVVHQQRDESILAHELCERSYRVARDSGNHALAAEALNTLGGIHLSRGSLTEARCAFLQALDLGAACRELRARVTQNLGILANIQGHLDEALAQYQQSLQAYREAGDRHGCAIAYHNLGMVSADRGLLDEAGYYFHRSRTLAEREGDAYLQGLALVSQAEVDVARQRYENARQQAEEALVLFDSLGTPGAKADPYRVLGMVFRETGRPALAESRFRSACELAVSSGSVLSEAETSRELALLYQSQGRNQEALRMLNTSHRLFRRLDARVDLIDVGGKVAELEGAYRAVVREWGRSIESSDGSTFGHCERVARLAVALARTLELDEQEETCVLLGAYLHDLGKVRVPHEILYKPGPLTPEERTVVQQHPQWGVELLATVEFPWDIKSVIRWHHEHYDGSGYPDRLRGDEIPLAAQIVGIAEVYDALTTARSYQARLSDQQALAVITRVKEWWAPRIVDAFQRSLSPGAAPA